MFLKCEDARYRNIRDSLHFMASSTLPRQYPVPCPKCENVKGYPYQVRTLTSQQGSIEVKLRCRDCSNEWVEIVDNTN